MTAPLTPDALAELERLEAAATAGPWSPRPFGNRDDGHEWYFDFGTWEEAIVVYGNEDAEWERQGKANAALIEAARNALPALIEAARRETRLREALTKYGRHVRGCHVLMPMDSGVCTCGLRAALAELLDRPVDGA